MFVFGLSQVSHHLVAHLSWRGVAEALVLLLAVIRVWSFASWAATIIPADQSKTRRMMLTVRLPTLFMNAAASTAFTTSRWAFIAPMLLVQLASTVWMIVNANDPLFRSHYRQATAR